jgi:hypothetical protein
VIGSHWGQGSYPIERRLLVMTKPRDYGFEIFLTTGMVVGAVAIGSIWGWPNALAFLAGGALGAPFVIRRWRPLRRLEK